MLSKEDKAAYDAVQNAYGVDVELLRENRRLTLEERYERYRRAMSSIHWLKLVRDHSRPATPSQGA